MNTTTDPSPAGFHATECGCGLRTSHSSALKASPFRASKWDLTVAPGKGEAGTVETSSPAEVRLQKTTYRGLERRRRASEYFDLSTLPDDSFMYLRRGSDASDSCCRWWGREDRKSAFLRFSWILRTFEDSTSARVRLSDLRFSRHPVRAARLAECSAGVLEELSLVTMVWGEERRGRVELS